MVPSALSPSLSPVLPPPALKTHSPGPGLAILDLSACLVRVVHHNMSLLCPLLLVQKTWKCSPKSGLQIAAPFLWLVKSVGNLLVGLFTLHHWWSVNTKMVPITERTNQSVGDKRG